MTESIDMKISIKLWIEEKREKKKERAHRQMKKKNFFSFFLSSVFIDRCWCEQIELLSIKLMLCKNEERRKNGGQTLKMRETRGNEIKKVLKKDFLHE